MIEASSTGRAASAPDEIGGAAAFLLGPEGAFVDGSDLLVDGGVTASVIAPSSPAGSRWASAEAAVATARPTVVMLLAASVLPREWWRGNPVGVRD